MVTLVGSPAAAAPYRSLASVFVVGADNAMYQLPQIIPNGGWGQWINRGTPAGVRLIPSPAVSFNNFIDIFGLNPVVAGGDGSLYAFPLTNETGPWRSLGGNNLTNPSVGVDGSGLQAVFALWAVGGPDLILQSLGDQSRVSGWTSHPGVLLALSQPAVAQNTPSTSNPHGGYEVFAAGVDLALWHIHQTVAGNGWAGWESFGKPPGVNLFQPAVAASQDGRLEVFVPGSDGALWHIWQQNFPLASWSGWYSHGAPPSGLVGSLGPALHMNAFGKLELFVVARDGSLWEIYQTAESNGWSDWYSHGGGLASRPTLTSSQDGRLELFVIGTDSALWHIWQVQKIDDSTISNWSAWFSHGTP